MKEFNKHLQTAGQVPHWALNWNRVDPTDDQTLCQDASEVAKRMHFTPWLRQSVFSKIQIYLFINIQKALSEHNLTSSLVHPYSLPYCFMQAWYVLHNWKQTSSHQLSPHLGNNYCEQKILTYSHHQTAALFICFLKYKLDISAGLKSWAMSSFLPSPSYPFVLWPLIGKKVFSRSYKWGKGPEEILFSNIVRG